MDKEENMNITESFVYLVTQLNELKAIKECIRKNTVISKDGRAEISLFFGNELLNLIKYIDVDFYKELKQQARH